MKVGVVGLGAMGSPMALNLLDAGHELLVYDLSSSAVAALVAKGAAAASACGAGVDVVLTMVPNDKVLREVTCNSATGLLQPLRGVHLSCSTVHPDVSRELAALHAQAGSSYVGAPIPALDAPRSGSPRSAWRRRRRRRARLAAAGGAHAGRGGGGRCGVEGGARGAARARNRPA